MTALVSIITPVYKGATFVGKTIESVLAQSYPHFELIIVNDGSPDDSADVIRPYLSDGRIKYLEQANAGVAAARNTAFSHARGDFVALLDQDDVWAPKKIERQLALFQSNANLGLVHCHAKPVNAEGNPLPGDPYYPRKTRSDAFEEIFLGNPIVACCAMFRRDVIGQASAFDTNSRLRFADEYDLWLRIAFRHEVGYVPETLAYYRLHETNNSRNLVPMTHATLAVLAKIRREFPCRVAEIPGKSLRGRYAFLYRHMALAYRAQHTPLLAVYWGVRALFRAPWQVVGRSISPAMRDRLSWYRKRLNLPLDRGH